MTKDLLIVICFSQQSPNGSRTLLSVWWVPKPLPSLLPLGMSWRYQSFSCKGWTEHPSALTLAYISQHAAWSVRLPKSLRIFSIWIWKTSPHGEWRLWHSSESLVQIQKQLHSWVCRSLQRHVRLRINQKSVIIASQGLSNSLQATASGRGEEKERRAWKGETQMHMQTEALS